MSTEIEILNDVSVDLKERAFPGETPEWSRVVCLALTGTAGSRRMMKGDEESRWEERSGDVVADACAIADAFVAALEQRRQGREKAAKGTREARKQALRAKLVPGAWARCYDRTEGAHSCDHDYYLVLGVDRARLPGEDDHVQMFGRTEELSLFLDDESGVALVDLAEEIRSLLKLAAADVIDLFWDDDSTLRKILAVEVNGVPIVAPGTWKALVSWGLPVEATPISVILGRVRFTPEAGGEPVLLRRDTVVQLYDRGCSNSESHPAMSLLMGDLTGRSLSADCGCAPELPRGIYNIDFVPHRIERPAPATEAT